MDIRERALHLHKEWQGKIETRPRVQVRNADDLTMAYTPGVAEPCKEINKDPRLVDVYTRRWNQVAVVSDGSAVLGLGNIGARAAMPVMEGKSVLFKSFAGVDAFPICIDSQDVDEIVRTVQLLTPTFGGVNLEDIAAPRCFEIERRLKETTDIPIFHDDQHGTAVVVLSAIINACKITNRELSDLKVVINGAGAAGIACGKLLLDVGVQDVILCDSKGIVSSKRSDLNAIKKEMLKVTNKEDRSGTLADAMVGASCFIGVSVKDAVTPEMVRSMGKGAILFAMANPVPEILPDVARAAGAAVVGTGRSDFPNQVNNVLGFPGIFRGALDVKASDINEAMKIAAAHALADLVGDRLTPEFVMPEAFDPRVAPAVAAAVARAAVESGVAREPRDPEWVKRHTEELIAR
ncbi:NAD(P)-dependent malic enzyme [Moorella sp. Hama-1]|uniref:NAD(P)-dependent malic enzyme n=1 Tax=Moorella sp. Hama-1 TaxID=2138101 RepID=UPI000D6540CE|nr:NADP-dependent malic enzyme [Moorella sp. Hama-1]BCV20233.1 malate dehydrogenase [Moorella sp. Hama-1]